MKKLCFIFSIIIILIPPFVKQVKGNEQYPYRFRRIQSEGILDYNGIRSIAQDSNGYIWFNTNDELYRFDAYQVLHSRELIDFKENSGISRFNYIYYDSRGVLWVSSNIGLLKYNSYYSSLELEFSLGEDINFLAEGKNNHLWFLTLNQIGFYNPDDKTINAVEVGLKSDAVFTALYSDNQYTLFGTSNGEVYSYDNNTFSFKLFYRTNSSSLVRSIKVYNGIIYCLINDLGLIRFDSEGKLISEYNFFLEEDIIKNNNIGKALHIDSNGLIWIGTQRGLYLLNPSDGEYKHFICIPEDDLSLPSNSIWSFAEDNQGGMWIGTYYGGLAYSNIHDHKFKLIRNSPSNTSNTSNTTNNFITDFVSSIAEDEVGDLWIGTEGKGLYFLNRKTEISACFRHHFNYNSLNFDNVKALQIDNKGNLWIGMFNGGIDFYNIETKQFTNYSNNPFDRTSLIHNDVYGLQLESDSGLWIGTYLGYVDFFHISRKTFTHIDVGLINQNSANNHVINSIYRGSDDKLWIASKKGLVALDIRTKEYKHYYIDKTDTISSGKNEVYTVLQDKDGKIWVGTRGNGLIEFNPINEQFTHFPIGEGVESIRIYSIQEDVNSKLWFSSNNGLYRFDTETKTYRVFNKNDGLQGNLFYPNSSFKCRSGELIFGGSNGLTIFDPTSIKENPVIPNAFFTGLVINNKRVNFLPGPDGEMVRIDQAKEIFLKYNETVFSIEFTGINYLMPEKNKFAFKLIGYDKTWNYVSANKRYATYSNLPAGNYTFSVLVSNNDGIWNPNEKTINITILPSPWKTTWAYLLYLMVGSLLILITFRIIKIRKNYRMQVQMERIGREQQSELNRIKIQFFTNISHEFKTPLTLIVAPLKKIIKSLDQDSPIKKDIDLINRNVIRLQNLINQLMTFRALENKKVTINYVQGELVSFFKEISSLFIPLTEELKIHFIFESSIDRIIACFDHDKFEKIFYNIISNAVKFTPSEGHIIVILEIVRSSKVSKDIDNTNSGLDMIEVNVSNTGAEISPEQQSQIFNSYFNIGKSNSHGQRSSGIGLAYTKKLIELLGGEIAVSSNSVETSFKVRIPILNNDIQESITADDSQLPYNFDFSKEFVNILSQKIIDKSNFHIQNRNPKIILAEDSIDLQNFIYELLIPFYNVYTASGGTEALKLAGEINPVLIIIDVIMPGLSGIELCERLKNDIATSHIPVILLSALSTQEHKNKGMQSGADVYIEKPFDPEYLILQVNNLIKSRESIRQAFSGKIALEPEKITITSIDEVFIKKAIKTIEENISNSDYNVDQFVKDMAFSRTLLYQKIKSLTNQSVNEFIVNIRLKRAAQLLHDTGLTVSEIAYAVGFNEPKYFSTCFKKYFHISPSKFQKPSLNNQLEKTET